MRRSIYCEVMMGSGEKTGFSNQVQKIIYEVMGDYLPHTLEEVRKKCEESGIEMKEKNRALNTVVHRMKQNGKIRSTGQKGTYILEKDLDKLKQESHREEKKKEENLQKEEKESSEWDRASILWPDEKTYGELRVTINEKGEIRLNETFRKKLKTDMVAVRFGNDYCVILLKEQQAGDGVYQYTKAGIIRNRGIVEKLKKRKIQLPASYTVTWNDKEKFWRGELKEKKVNA